jgi:glycosyltransferase involved in cell wall biosynthesis
VNATPLLLFIHDYRNVKAIRYIGVETFPETNAIGQEIIPALLNAANRFPHYLIGWCHESVENKILLDNWSQLIHHPFEMVSFEPGSTYWINPRIGYVDFSSPFIHSIPKDVRFGTWQTSATCGLVYAKTLSQFETLAKTTRDIRTFLSAVAKNGSLIGLFPYSDPKLVSRGTEHEGATSMVATLQLIKSYYGLKWVFFWLVSIAIFEKKFSFYLWMKSIFIPRLKRIQKLDGFIEYSTKNNAGSSIEVIIPTIGRAQHVQNVLNDLAQQSLIPQYVTIIEQLTTGKSETELTFLQQTEYPFEIKNTIIHQAGACNARNIALCQLNTSDWVFFADDDIRLEKDTLLNAVTKGNEYGLGAVTLAVYREHESIQRTENPIGWNNFASGCSIVRTQYASQIQFDMNLEFGFGEDSDYGVALRKIGCTIGYLALDPILHLKAPMGGFRTPFVHPWKNEHPKPAPTILYHFLKNQSRYQLNGYQLFFFAKQFLGARKWNLKAVYTRWNASRKWALYLQQLTSSSRE